MTDQPHYWFARKTYGWGWKPASWQGWLALVVYGAVLIPFGRDVSPSSQPVVFWVGLAVTTGILFALCSIKGEPPRDR